MALIKKYKCMNIGNCKDANRTVIEIPVGEKLECPTCHKEMLVEVKTGINMKMIAAVAAVVVLGGGVGAYYGGVFDGIPRMEALVTDSVAAVDSVVNQVDGADNKTAKVTKTTDQNPGGETKGGETKTSILPNPAINLDYATYDGPANGGKPHGIGGTLLIKKNYSLNLKDAKGGMLDMSPGDKIVNTKFTNGVLNQGELQRKSGERTYFVIGG